MTQLHLPDLRLDAVAGNRSAQGIAGGLVKGVVGIVDRVGNADGRSTAVEFDSKGLDRTPQPFIVDDRQLNRII